MTRSEIQSATQKVLSPDNLHLAIDAVQSMFLKYGFATVRLHVLLSTKLACTWYWRDWFALACLLWSSERADSNSFSVASSWSNTVSQSMFK